MIHSFFYIFILYYGDNMGIYYDEDNLVIYLNINNKIDDEELCEDIIYKLDKYYNIKLKGFYDVYIYNEDKNYIIEFIEDNIEVSDYYNKADIHIKNIPIKLLYCVDDIFNINTNYYYIYKDKYYIFYDDVNINNMEFGNIEYKNVDDILNLGYKIVM